VNLALSINGLGSLWAMGKRLGLNPPDRVKYALSWYMSRRAIASLAPGYFIVRLPGGSRVPIRPNGADHNTLADTFARRLYELPAAGVRRVLDLGANIGAATVFLAAKFPGAEFACVEPFPDNQTMLREAIRLNRLRATVLEGAAGVVSGKADLYLTGAPDSFSLTPAAAGAPTLRVRSFTVPEILAKLGWEEIDLLKIDIEGYEKTLFRENNGWLHRVRWIVGEAHGHVNYRIDDVRADLAPLGFEVTLRSYEPKYELTIFEARRGDIAAPAAGFDEAAGRVRK
jgi:FkbM family methyltransferase